VAVTSSLRHRRRRHLSTSSHEQLQTQRNHVKNTTRARSISEISALYVLMCDNSQLAIRKTV